MACSAPSSFFYASRAPKEWFMILTYCKNGFPATGDARTRGLVRYALISSKAFWQVSSQTKDMPSSLIAQTVDSDLTSLRWTYGCKLTCLEDLGVFWDSLEAAYLEWLWSCRDRDEFFWMWQWISVTCHMKLPKKASSGLSSAGEPA